MKYFKYIAIILITFFVTRQFLPKTKEVTKIVKTQVKENYNKIDSLQTLQSLQLLELDTLNTELIYFRTRKNYWKREYRRINKKFKFYEKEINSLNNVSNDSIRKLRSNVRYKPFK